MTIGETIIEKAQGSADLTPDWYANELYSELSQVAETRFTRNRRTLFFLILCSVSRKISFL